MRVISQWDQEKNEHINQPNLKHSRNDLSQFCKRNYDNINFKKYQTKGNVELGKKTQWALAFAVMVVALISVTAAAVSAKPTTTEHHTTKVVAVKKVAVKQANPYENLSTQRQKVVKAADLATLKGFWCKVEIKRRSK